MVWFKEKKKRLIIFLGLTVILLITVFLFLLPSKKYSVSAGNCLFKSEGALTQNDQYRGLSGRKNLDANQGMIFVFNEKEDRSFVMRDMLFPLDIIFISDNRVVNLYNELPPEGNDPQTTYHSGAPINAVLEISAGRARSCGIGVGSEITW